MTEPSDQLLDGPSGPLRVRVYRAAVPAGPGLVWLHGGAFAAGSIDMPEADWVASEFAARGIAVVSVDYRLAPTPPEWADARGAEASDGVRYPVASDEAVFAFRWAASSGLAAGPWALGGASAGGNLAAGAVLRMLRDRAEGHDVPDAAEALVVPALAVLAYPTLHAVQPASSAQLAGALAAEPAGTVFEPSRILAMYENYLGGPVDEADAVAIPGLAQASDLAGFPPTIMVNDDVDALRTSGEAFAATLADAGREVDVSTEPGTRHGHLNRPDEPDAALATIERFAARILRLVPPAPRPPTA